jgi:hypothetical protein
MNTTSAQPLASGVTKIKLLVVTLLLVTVIASSVLAARLVVAVVIIPVILLEVGVSLAATAISVSKL